MGLTNERIKQIALQQSALDANCKVEDFTCGRNVVTVSKENAFARKYLKQCNKSGFRPAWVQMTVKSSLIVEEMNM